MARKAVRALITLIFLAGGISLGCALTNDGWLEISNLILRFVVIIAPGIVLGLLGFILAPWVIAKILDVIDWIEKNYKDAPG